MKATAVLQDFAPNSYSWWGWTVGSEALWNQSTPTSTTKWNTGTMAGDPWYNPLLHAPTESGQATPWNSDRFQQEQNVLKFHFFYYPGPSKAGVVKNISSRSSRSGIIQAGTQQNPLSSLGFLVCFLVVFSFFNWRRANNSYRELYAS